MKTIIFQLGLFFILSSVSNSQITPDYPFKTYLDSDNNLYITGCRQEGSSKDIYTAKFPPNNEPNALWERTFSNPFGDDRGLDLDVDKQGNTYVTGYIFNNLPNSNDIIVLKYNSDGVLQWDSVYNNSGDDKAFGIDLSFDSEDQVDGVFISGYVTQALSGKDFIIKKYSRNGNSLWQDVHNQFSGDDIATDILLDEGYAYVGGYTYQNGNPQSDVMMLVYNKTENSLTDLVVFDSPQTNEKPTEFIITYYSTDWRQKSRCAVASVTDDMGFSNSTTKYLTLFFNPNINQKMIIEWSRILSNGSSSQTNVATSIAADSLGDVYVSGYMFNYNNWFQSNGLDFATVKYIRSNGRFGWNPNPVKFYNFSDTTAGINDKASSVKVNAKKDIYVAGTSDGSLNGFSIVKYEQTPGNPNPIKSFDKVFIPNFVESDHPVRLTNKHAKIELANDGTPLMIVMGWNQTEAHWAAIKYDAEGEIEYTINNQSEGTDNAGTNNIKKSTTKISLDNYPNPFNPVTKINYELPVERIGNSFYNVKLTVYNTLGSEVATLVNQKQNAGKHSVTFNAADLSSGIYFYELSLNGIAIETKRMLLVK